MEGEVNSEMAYWKIWAYTDEITGMQNSEKTGTSK